MTIVILTRSLLSWWLVRVCAHGCAVVVWVRGQMGRVCSLRVKSVVSFWPLSMLVLIFRLQVTSRSRPFNWRVRVDGMERLWGFVRYFAFASGNRWQLGHLSFCVHWLTKYSVGAGAIVRATWSTLGRLPE